jgi:hypothetical protein
VRSAECELRIEQANAIWGNGGRGTGNGHGNTAGTGNGHKNAAGTRLRRDYGGQAQKGSRHKKVPGAFSGGFRKSLEIPGLPGKRSRHLFSVRGTRGNGELTDPPQRGGGLWPRVKHRPPNSGRCATRGSVRVSTHPPRRGGGIAAHRRPFVGPRISFAPPGRKRNKGARTLLSHPLFTARLGGGLRTMMRISRCHHSCESRHPSTLL